MTIQPALQTAAPALRLASRFLRDTKGSTAIEYSLIASIIAMAIVGSVTAIGELLEANFYAPVNAGFEQADQPG